MTQATHSMGYQMPPIGFEAPTLQDREVVGLRLRRARKEKGLTLAQASERAGLSRSTIGSIERGEHDLNSLSRRNLINLPSAFGLSAAEFSSIVRPVYGDVLVSDFAVGGNMTDNIIVQDIKSEKVYARVRIKPVKSGIQNNVDNLNDVFISVSEELARQTLGGLVMDKSYVNGIPAGFFAIWSERRADVGELVVVEKNGGLFPAFLAAGGMVEVDHYVHIDVPNRFKPDRILGAIEEVRMLELPKRSLS